MEAKAIDYSLIAEAHYNDLLAGREVSSEEIAHKIISAMKHNSELEARRQYALHILDGIGMELSELANEAYIADRPVKAKAFAHAYQIIFNKMVELSSPVISEVR